MKATTVTKMTEGFEIASFEIGTDVRVMRASALHSRNTVRVWCFGHSGPRKDFRV